MFILTSLILFGVHPQRLIAKTNSQDNIQQVSLILSPADVPSPVMKYRLTVPLGQTREANAVVDYYNAVIDAEILTAEEIKKIDKWLDLPWEEVPHEEAQAILNKLNHAFSLLESGVTCRNCYWQINIEEGYSVILPHLGKHRQR